MAAALLLPALACDAERTPPAAPAGRPATPASPLEAATTANVSEASASSPAAPEAVPAETALGVADRGIFSDLDAAVQIPLPAGLSADQTSAVVDPGHRVLVLYQDDYPVKAYPLGGPEPLAVGELRLALRPGDRAELAPLLRAGHIRELAAGEAPPPGDRDGDLLPDPLDLAIGAAKNALNAAEYIGGYETLAFPGGDVPRERGVCTDVIVRAARNAGFDLQVELRDDIRRAPRAYPMVKRANPNIDQRRVKTVLPYFVRHWQAHSAALDDPADPMRPGDVVFMDTFPSKPGPDHVGIVSNHTGASGLPLITNAWTEGYRASEMDLLSFVPVTHRFRIPPR